MERSEGFPKLLFIALKRDSPDDLTARRHYKGNNSPKSG